jgi:hypothetical protein
LPCRIGTTLPAGLWLGGQRPVEFRANIVDVDLEGSAEIQPEGDRSAQRHRATVVCSLQRERKRDGTHPQHQHRLVDRQRHGHPRAACERRIATRIDPEVNVEGEFHPGLGHQRAHEPEGAFW